MPDEDDALRRGAGPLIGRLREELRDYTIVVAYLYVCLAALLLYKSAVLRGVGVEYLPAGLAAVKALILGKFALLGKAVGLGERKRSGTVLQIIARKALLFLMLLIALSIVEELLVGWWHGWSVAQTIAEFSSDPVMQVLADALVLQLVILPLIAAVEISRALGAGVLSRTLRTRPGCGTRADRAD